MPKLRVGIFRSLDCRPLAWGFLKGHHGDLFAPSYHSPALIAQLLAQGNLDIGLLPAIDVQRIAGLRVLPDLCLASRGGTRTALLVSGVELDEVRRVAVDQNSRTGIALLEVLLHERLGAAPELVPQHPSLERMLSEHDAALLIGDAALQVDVERYRVLDLAAEWHTLTGLPCVFAVWAVREGVDLPDLPFYFKSSLRYGMSLLDNMVRESAAELDLDVAEVEAYLTRHLSFVLRQEERQGLEELFRRAAALGLIEGPRPLRLWGE